MSPIIPQCQSWRGHKFEARYDTVETEGELAKRVTHIRTIDESLSAFADGLKLKTYTYRGDVCVRCGQTVEAPQ